MTDEFKPFSLGGVRIGFPVVLASLAGYTDLAYRMLCRRRGAEYCASEMILDRCVLARRRKPNPLIAIGEQDHPVGGQLIGNDPATMADAAVALSRLGFDVVDLNFACPVNKALRRKRGGFLMNDPARVLEITRAVRAACDRPVTLKLRRRYRHEHEDDNLWRIAEGAFDAGAAAVAVHARSVEAKYSGPADWEFLAELKRRFPERTVLGSGDMLTPAAALEALRDTGVDGVLAARGALGNPWFFRQVKDLAAGREPFHPSLAEQRNALLEHLAGAVELYGPEKGPRMMRKFGIKYARLHPTPKAVRIAFVAVKRPEDWYDVVERYYTD